MVRRKAKKRVQQNPESSRPSMRRRKNNDPLPSSVPTDGDSGTTTQARNLFYTEAHVPASAPQQTPTVTRSKALRGDLRNSPSSHVVNRLPSLRNRKDIGPASRVRSTRQVTREISRTSPRIVGLQLLGDDHVECELRPPISGQDRVSNPTSQEEPRSSIGRNLFESRPGTDCSDCTRHVVVISELKARNSELAADKIAERRQVALLESAKRCVEEDLRVLKTRYDTLVSHNERLIQQKVGKGARKNNLSFALSIKHKNIGDHVENMAHDRLTDDFTESMIDKNGYRVRDWLLKDENSNRFWVISDVERYDIPIINTGVTEGANRVCPLEISTSGEFHVSRYGGSNNFLHNILLDAIEMDHPPMFHGFEKDSALQVLQKVLGPEFHDQKRSVKGGHKKAVRCSFLSMLGYEALGKTTSVPSEADQR